MGDQIEMRERETAVSRGSIWRRWDPHVHLPGTLVNDQFGSLSVAEALDELAAREPAIEAVGVTDYFTTASFRRTVEAWEGGAGDGIKFLFPNVELRLDIPTKSGSGVNIHLLCHPIRVDWLDRFLGGLTFTWKGNTTQAKDLCRPMGDRSGTPYAGSANARQVAR